MQVKICGLKTKESVDCVEKYGAAYVGFVFYPFSPRYIKPAEAAKLAKKVKNAKTVAVVVDNSDEEIEFILKYFKPDYIQCHGREEPARVAQIRKKFGIKIIKAIQVRASDDVARSLAYADSADMLLFDAKVPTSAMPGGNGLAFDWTLLRERSFPLPWILSGGLNMSNLHKALDITGAKAIDLSSSLEMEPGVKDPELIGAFMRKVREYEHKQS